MHEQPNIEQIQLHDDYMLRRKEVTPYFNVPHRFLEKAAVSGVGPPMTKIGRAVYYRVGDLREWIRAHRVTSTSDGGAS